MNPLPTWVCAGTALGLLGLGPLAFSFQSGAADDATMAMIHSELQRRGVDAATSACISEVAAVARAAQTGAAPPPDVLSLQIPTSFANRPLVTPGLLQYARQNRIEVHASTIDDEGEMNGLLDLGVDGLVTDFPDRMATAVARRLGA